MKPIERLKLEYLHGRLNSNGKNENEKQTKSQEMPNECQKLLKEFRSNCLSSWVRHFESLRERDAVVKLLEKPPN